MKLGKIFKIFKKGSKAAAQQKGKGQKPDGGFKWPAGKRIGVYGHANSGKTVYFTVLNEECKVSRDLQISVTDNPTSAEFLANRRAIWGLGSTATEGTVVDLPGEKKFPGPTEEDRLLQFNAIVDRNQTLSVVTYDYPGKAVSITDNSPIRDKVADFMIGCDGLMFFFDPKSLNSELQCQSHVASFVNTLERIAPLEGRLPIPVALVITKADILAGFAGEGQTVLIDPENENFLSEDYEVFLEKVLSSNKIASDSAWAGSVRSVLVRMREFLKVVVGRTLNFQIFFCSNTGERPPKIGTDVGRSIYAPPTKIHPIGVREPFYWLLKSVIRNRRISRMRSITRVAVMVTLLWMVLYSLPFLFHFSYLLPKATNAEDAILEQHGGNFYSLPRESGTQIATMYSRYGRAKTVEWLFPNFKYAAKDVENKYRNANLDNAVKELDLVIARFAGMVADSTGWPSVKVGDTVFIENDAKRVYDEIGEAIAGFMKTDAKTSELYLRSERMSWFWTKFKEARIDPANAELWNLIKKKVEQDQNSSVVKLSKAEKELHQAFTSKKVEQEQIVVASQAGSELDDLVDEINNNTDPEYRLVDAVRKLRNIKEKLLGNPARKADIKRIDDYIEDARYFSKSRTYAFTISNLPEDHHLHVVVQEKGKSPNWPKEQMHKGKEYSIQWKSGDVILVALDAKHVAGGDPESWGENPKELLKLEDKSAIFRMDGTVTFNSGLKATFDLAEDVQSKLPELK